MKHKGKSNEKHWDSTFKSSEKYEICSTMIQNTRRGRENGREIFEELVFLQFPQHN